MNYPENLKIGDTIGICAPSAGISEPEKIEKLEIAEKNLENLGYKIIETDHVRTENFGRSANAKTRAKEFMELYTNKDVKLIIFATGGDFLCEMLDYLDWEKLKNLPPKWLQGYSDITGISYLFNTILDIPTMYCQTIKDYAMNPLFRNLTDALNIMSGKNVLQESFEMYEDEWLVEEALPTASYNLTKKVEWKNIKGEEKIQIQGRALGGCLDCIMSFIGTKYDNVKAYISSHKDDGIIWFLESFELGTATLLRTLWQMKSAGYFENCKGIIFGRPLFVREDYGVSFNETVKDFFKASNFPVICDADIGHKSPQMAIINGGILKITSENGKGIVETYLK